MCFSATASFGASALLVGFSLFSGYKLMQKKVIDYARLDLVGVPMAFGVQQFSEGMVWLSLLHDFSPLIKQISIYTFIFFAFIFWPTYVPFCVIRLERVARNKSVLKMIQLIGLIISAILFYRVIFFGIDAEIANCHIMYSSDLTNVNMYVALVIMAGYLLTTVGALLLSSLRGMRVLGVLIGIAYVLSLLFYQHYLISVWCFFAAIVSLLVDQMVLRKMDR